MVYDFTSELNTCWGNKSSVYSFFRNVLIHTKELIQIHVLIYRLRVEHIDDVITDYN